jgi:hypothetical protein
MLQSTVTLTEHAARLLIGTGISPTDAVAVASGAAAASPNGQAVAAALRDGWQAADTHTWTDQ